MSWSLQDIQNQISSELDQDETAPTVGGTDWLIRLNTINRANLDWANSGEWRALKAVHNGLVSTATGNASYSLPTNFKKIDGYPRIVSDGTTMYEFPVVDPSKTTQYTDSDRFVNILGNEKDANVMFIHANTIASGASVQFTYWKSPATISSATDVIECPDPTFLVQRALYYLYKGREDGRFPEAKVEADRILARMIENENSRGIAELDRKIPNELEEKYAFRIGLD